MKANVSCVTEKTATNGDTNRKYILAGGGITISILLFLIIVQLYHCKRSKSAKNRTLKLKACQRMYTSEECHQIGNDLSIETRNPLEHINNFNEHADIDNHDTSDLG